MANNYENIKVSIVVPIYNVEPYLVKLLDSLIMQTHHNLEIILVDDGSPDRCGEICDRYAQEDNRIIVIHKKNAGGCAARNSGIDIATGDYISFVDGDDWLAVDAIEYMVDLAETTNSDMALSKCHFTTRDMQQTSDNNLIREVWSSEEAIVAIFLPLFAVGCWNKLYRASLIHDHRLCFDVPWYGEGLYFASMSAAYANHIAVGNKKVYYYRKNNPTSATTFYKVSNIRNGLSNTRLIRQIIPVRTPLTKWAINQHLRNNYFEALMIVLATKTIFTNLFFFLHSWICYLVYTPYVLLYGYMKAQQRYTKTQVFSMIKHAIFPLRYARKRINQELSTLQNDKIL